MYRKRFKSNKQRWLLISKIVISVFLFIFTSICNSNAVEIQISDKIVDLIGQERKSIITEIDRNNSSYENMLKSFKKLSIEEQERKYSEFLKFEYDAVKTSNELEKKLDSLEPEIIIKIIESSKANKLSVIKYLNSNIQLSFYERIKKNLKIIVVQIICLVIGSIIALYIRTFFIEKRNSNNADKFLNEAISKANEESKNILVEANKKAKINFDSICAEARSIYANSTQNAQRNEQLRVELFKWQETLKSANQKLRVMKEQHRSVEGKIYRVIRILEENYPEAKKHLRYLRNKVRGMANSYANAKGEFDNLYGKE